MAKLTHKQKVHLANRMRTRMEQKGYDKDTKTFGRVPISIFNSAEWILRRVGRAERLLARAAH